jgi:hypothetical protein
MINRTDIELVIEDFKVKSGPNDRYASFDYCYNYFRSTKDLNVDIEKSCLILGFYLASWGMFRGSSFLLQHSVKHFKPTIEYINTLDKSVWLIDVDNYCDDNMKIIVNIYKEIKIRLIPNGNTDLTLITKVLLGVFGFIPAFDTYFCDTFRALSNGQCGFRRVNKISLSYIHNFYQENNYSIDNLSAKTFTTDFLTGGKTKINYPKAKIIDMYGFNSGQFIQTEKIFEILAEGGGICISRQKNELGEKFIYHHNEFDPTDEGLDINKKDEYDNFQQPFQLINEKYPWYMLYLETVHNDYSNFIIECLIEKLNQESVLPEYLEYSQGRLENSLKIKLNCSKNQNTNSFVWSCEKTM